MRFANPRLIRLAALTKGAIVDPGDGELLVPAVLQPVIELPSPLSLDHSIPVVAEDSTICQTNVQINGVAAALGSNLLTLKPGLWRFHWHCQGAFRGTNNVANDVRLVISDPNNVSIPIWTFPLLTPGNANDNGTFLLLAQPRPAGATVDWVFSISSLAATVAADLLAVNITLIANRLQ